MAEIAGLVLGAAGILVPAYQGYQICSTVIADAKDFSKNFRKIKLDLKTQKDIFSGECELLLKEIIDNSVLQEMLRDQGHDQWKDAGFQAAFYSYLGGSLEDKFPPFKIVRETLDEIMKEVSEFQDKMNSCPDPAASTLAEASRRVKSIGKRVNWALSKKPNS